MRALDVATKFENLKIWTFRSETMAGVLGRFSFATASEKQLKQRKHRKKHCFLVVGLEEVLFRRELPRKSKITNRPSLTPSRAIRRRN